MEENNNSGINTLKPKIIEAFEKLHRKIFTDSEMEAIVRECRDLWHLKKT